MNQPPTSRTIVMDIDPRELAGESRPPRAPVKPRPFYPDSRLGTELQGTEADILSAMVAAGSPLTLGQLHRMTDIPVSNLVEATTALCNARLVSRLNTIIESYVPRSLTVEREPMRSHLSVDNAA